MTMGTYWPHKVRGKKAHHIRKPSAPSQTTGRQKGIIIPPLWRTLCRRNRSFKHEMYDYVLGFPHGKLNGEKLVRSKKG